MEIPFVNGASLFAKTGMTGATGNYYCGLHEADEMGFILHVLRPGDLLLDIGANIGSYSILAAAGRGAAVIAFEPVPSTNKHLQRNIILNGLEHLIQNHQCAIGEKPGEINFSTDKDTMNKVVDDSYTGEFKKVAVARLDDVCSINTETVAKIDVEGFEWEVLSGGSKTLSDPRLIAVIMETNGAGSAYGHKNAEIIEKMESFGFQRIIYNSITRNIQATHNISSYNTIFVRDIVQMQQRTRGASKTLLSNGTAI